MQTDEFEWDDDKAASNLVKHGVSFEEATFAFDDAFAIEDIDPAALHNEYRTQWIGWDGQRLLVVIHTDRGPRKRIISAREAEPDEYQDYNRCRRP